jgi:hypothetical protein
MKKNKTLKKLKRRLNAMIEVCTLTFIKLIMWVPINLSIKLSTYSAVYSFFVVPFAQNFIEFLAIVSNLSFVLIF